VDQGASYDNAETVKTAFEKSGGLTATTLHVYNPDRSNRFWGKPKVSIESVLGTILDRQDMSLTARKHSSYGTGFKIAASETFIFKKIADYKRGLPVRAMPRGSVPVFRDIESLVLDFCGGSHQEQRIYRMILWKTDCPRVGPLGASVVPLCPSVLTLDTAKRNPKANLPSKRARPGEGENHPNQRKRRRNVRMTARKRKREMGVEELREVKQAHGIFLCLAKCPTTGRYCPEEFLTESGKGRHEAKGKHNFPSFDSNSELILQASRPGGLVAAGSRPNLMSDVLFVTIEEAPADTLGLENTICFGKFNRKELASDEKYHKPERLVKEMLRLYKIGQDGGAPKLKPKEIRNILSKMVDPTDGGLLFCYSKRGSWPRQALCALCNHNPCDCNGMLLPLKIVTQWMNSQTQKKRNDQKKIDEAAARA
jgi:hypothetical protein